jgi:hypothetical protein
MNELPYPSDLTAAQWALIETAASSTETQRTKAES